VKKIILLCLIIVLGLGVFSLTPLKKMCCSSQYKTFESPSGNYHVSVFSIPMIPMIMPGGAGDTAGFVQLIDKNGNVLKEKDVEMVQLIDEVNWSDKKVSIPLFTEWPLNEAK
jgi:hypothetical protein